MHRFNRSILILWDQLSNYCVVAYGGREGPFQTSNFSISISEFGHFQIRISEVNCHFKIFIETFILASNSTTVFNGFCELRVFEDR